MHGRTGHVKSSGQKFHWRRVPSAYILHRMSELDSEPRLLDVKGLNCPMPLLKAKKALNEMPPQALLKVLATDPGSVRDFEVFSRQSGHELLEAGRDGDTYVYVLRKKPD